MEAQCYSGQHIAYRLGTQQRFDRRCLEKAFYSTLPRLRGNTHQKGYDWLYPAMVQVERYHLWLIINGKYSGPTTNRGDVGSTLARD